MKVEAILEIEIENWKRMCSEVTKTKYLCREKKKKELQ